MCSQKKSIIVPVKRKQLPIIIKASFLPRVIPKISQTPFKITLEINNDQASLPDRFVLFQF